MEILYLLIPLAILLVLLFAAIFMWAVKSGQFDDLEGPAHAILMDEDELETARKNQSPDLNAQSDNKSKDSKQQ